MVIRRPRSKSVVTPPLPDLPRVESLKVLGVTLQSNLSMREHVNNVIAKSGQTLYALKAVKAHGLSQEMLSMVTRATLMSGLTYASPAWIGFANAEDMQRLQSPVKRAIRWGLLSSNLGLTFSSISEKADISLFSKVSALQSHVLHSMLPPRTNYSHNLRPRRHDFVLPRTSTLLHKNFFHRMLYLFSGVN